MTLSRVVSEIFNVEKRRDLEIGVKGHSRSSGTIRRRPIWFHILVFFSKFVPTLHRFWDIRLLSIQWPWNPGLGSLKSSKMIPFDPASVTFLLTFRINHRPISHRFRVKRRFPMKIANFSHRPCILRPRWRGSPWNWVSAQGSEKKLEWRATRWSKNFMIGLVV